MRECQILIDYNQISQYQELRERTERKSRSCKRDNRYCMWETCTVSLVTSWGTLIHQLRISLLVLLVDEFSYEGSSTVSSTVCWCIEHEVDKLQQKSGLTWVGSPFIVWRFRLCVPVEFSFCYSKRQCAEPVYTESIWDWVFRVDGMDTRVPSMVEDS